MIDKVTFAIILIKLLGIQVILAGIVISAIEGNSQAGIFISLGSLVFAIASNCLLAHVVYEKRKK